MFKGTSASQIAWLNCNHCSLVQQIKKYKKNKITGTTTNHCTISHGENVVPPAFKSKAV